LALKKKLGGLHQKLRKLAFKKIIDFNILLLLGFKDTTPQEMLCTAVAVFMLKTMLKK